ncbi:MAG: PASTA domain-containing protein [Saprospiraceae bacterium]|nr:MAG: D-alanine--D-alanine ligase [Bacteroidetes bacterium OLB9]MCO6462971.1 PASTA domain-containing protein [Saprospiraceae bacterium]
MADNNSEGGFLKYVFSMVFVKQLLMIMGGLLILLLLVLLWLRIYTHHGQKIELPDFIGKNIGDARQMATDHDFEIIAADSLFIVGKPGGLITDQNPKPGSMVKERRKIYVTVTKYIKETVRVADLPTLYGNAYEQKKTELKYRDIESVIKDYKYDPGEPNHILEVYYNGELVISRDGRKDNVVIEKGGTLEFVLSRRDGGDVMIPNLKCVTLDEAKFILESSRLMLGDISKRGEDAEDAVWYIIAQSPPYDGITNIKMGDKVSVTVATKKPDICD